MKLFRTCLYLLWLPLPSLAFAQAAGSWGAMVQKIDAKPYQGKRFRLEAAMKVAATDTDAMCGMWVRVDKSNKKTGFFNNMMDRPVRSKEWKVYTIEGKVDKGADSLAFGGLYFNRGKFYFDDFKLSVETRKGSYEPVNITDGDFEQQQLAAAWRYKTDDEQFIVSVTSETAYKGKKSLQADGSAYTKGPMFGNLDSVGKYVVVNGIKLYYEEYGSGTPLLLLHGNGQSIAAFAAQIPELAKHYRVIAIDTRGQGKSASDSTTYTYDLFAADMNALLDQLHIDSANILGWSDGGNTALIMAMRYPKKVKKAVVMGAVVFIDKTVVGKPVFKMVLQAEAQLRKDTSAKAANELRLMNLLLTEPRHTFEELKTITCPVLVIAGSNDMIKEGHTRGIAAAITHSTLYIAPGQTHFFPQENPILFNEVVSLYLAKGIVSSSGH